MSAIGMRLLMLSWRSPGHPQGGGAENLTQEVLRRLVANGHQVTWFSAMWPGAVSRESIDGVQMVRQGAQWSVHLRAWNWLRTRRNDFDVVVDQINTIPFFTPLYLPAEQRRMLIFQTAREFWWRQTPGLFKVVAPVGYLAEPRYLKLYRRTRAITISRSTRDELVGLGLSADAISIIPMANTFSSLETLDPKPGPFRVIVVGRLEPAKHVEDAVRAFAVLQRREPTARLDVVGTGAPAYRERLEAEVMRLGLRDVTFHGRVEEARKHELMAAAHVHVFCSRREGWGLTVTEAAGLGTPSIGYDVPGVRDSIGDERMLAARGDVHALAERLVALRDAPASYEVFRREAWERTRALSYEATTDAFLQALDV
ncbi:glycosyltransferase family 4 protein [Baekduia soli]|uniref:Glycosyltransferase family 4 protein n=1 Tax=Baekduia soli TaxID=496014 RepID=A0A5B8TZT1_9ACTN|nr:glycosyltransferase family 4 protein [Baekduia soli]QEC46236.1 glycosyltransferase family 4 protein [Baekduia soli]